MEPELREGDRLVIDTARRAPAAGELFALWDGTGLAVKRVEPHPRGQGAEAALHQPRLAALQPPGRRRAHRLGKVLWTIARV